MKTLTIVSPCFNEEKNIPIFIEQLVSLKEKLLTKNEIDLIIVDDYSSDSSINIIKDYMKKYSWIKVLKCPRNLGVFRATYAGLKIAKGELIVPMLPVDLQDPINALYEMIILKEKKKVTGVFGEKIMREENFFLSNLRKLFYKMLNVMSIRKINQNVGEFGVIDRWVIDECVKRNDYYPFIRAMIFNITDDILLYKYNWVSRVHGISSYNLFSLYDNAINGFISTGAQFFRLLTFIGFFVSIFSVLFGIVNIIIYLLDKSLFVASGIATIIVILCLFFGFLFIFLGFLGEYVVAIHAQVRGLDKFHLNNSQENKNKESNFITFDKCQ
jgi:glycosyltransferase involved in cell wall biosynthesis